MATRMRIAAAACVVASGLLVGGAGAALAIAAPEPGHSADTTGASTKPTGTATAAPTSGQAPADPTTSAATPASTATVTAPKPTSQVGDGRTGVLPDEPDGTRGSRLFSKQSRPDATAPSQTSSTRTGEPTATVSARIADVIPPTTTETTTPGPVPTLDQPTGEAMPPKDDDPEKYPGWHWWPWCWGHTPPGPGQPPGSGNPPSSGNGGGGISIGKPPIGVGIPKPPPLMQLPVPTLPRVVPPALPVISVDPVVDAITGLATAAADLPFTPLTLPVIVPPIGAGAAGAGGGAGGAGAGGAGTAPRPGTAAVPRTAGGPQGKNQPPKAQEPKPSTFGTGNGALPASYRVGYGDYLRSAGVGQMAAIAVPGVTGILVLTGAGGLLGYRQARAGHALRSGGTARFIG